VSAPRPPGEPPQIAKELARGEVPERLFGDLDPALRDRMAPFARACGERILDLEEHAARLEESLVDLRLALKSYSDVKRKLRQENEGLKAAVARSGRMTLVGADGGLSPVMRTVDKVASTPLPVLITGESGTGKEVIARHIHDSSTRAQGPFIAINCGALPEPLLESELFGIEKGVATGVEARAGKFQQANGGTLFLDEVADMTPAMQVKILRALQEHEVERVGGRRSIAVDVRIISATNKNLTAEVEAKRFRDDLFYRLVGVHIHLPPLRERRPDIGPLIDHFLETSARQLNRHVTGFSAEARLALTRYDWPGNVRQLAVEVQRSVAMADGDIVDSSDLSPAIAAGFRGAPADAGLELITGGKILTLKEVKRVYETAYIERVLVRAGGSQRRAANLLGVTEEGLRKKLRALGMNPRGDPRIGKPTAPAAAPQVAAQAPAPARADPPPQGA
jgi:DNA-binding NtrC family response regulator